MATHSSVLAWRIPGTEEPGGVPSMGSHRVGHNWSDLAAGVIVGDVTLIFIFWCLDGPMNHSYQTKYTECFFRVYTAFWEPFPSLEMFCCLTGTVTVFKSPFLCSIKTTLQDNREHGSISQFHEYQYIVNCFSCEWVPWSEAMLHGIQGQWRHPLSL